MLTAADHALFAYAAAHDSVFSLADAVAGGPHQSADPLPRRRICGNGCTTACFGSRRGTLWQGDLHTAVLAAGDGAAISHQISGRALGPPGWESGNDRADLRSVGSRSSGRTRCARKSPPRSHRHPGGRRDTDDLSEFLLLQMAATRPSELHRDVNTRGS